MPRLIWFWIETTGWHLRIRFWNFALHERGSKSLLPEKLLDSKEWPCFVEIGMAYQLQDGIPFHSATVFLLTPMCRSATGLVPRHFLRRFTSWRVDLNFYPVPRMGLYPHYAFMQSCIDAGRPLNRFSLSAMKFYTIYFLVKCLITFSYWLLKYEDKNKVRELILEGLFIMNLYQLDSQPSLLFGSTEKAAWKS